MISRLFYGSVVAFSAGNLIIDYWGSVARVDGKSMQPTFNPNPDVADFILLSKRKKYEISRGQIIILTSPKNPEMRLVKRVVAVEDDIVNKMGISGETVKIPTGHIWVEGDHIDKSVDSNNFGPVPLGLVVAKVTWIIWPFHRIQPVEQKLVSQSHRTSLEV